MKTDHVSRTGTHYFGGTLWCLRGLFHK